MSTRRVLFKSTTKLKGFAEPFEEGDIKRLPHATATRCIENGWGDDADTGESHEPKVIRTEAQPDAVQTGTPAE